MKELKISQLAPGIRYLQTLALKLWKKTYKTLEFDAREFSGFASLEK